MSGTASHSIASGGCRSRRRARNCPPTAPANEPRRPFARAGRSAETSARSTNPRDREQEAEAQQCRGAQCLALARRGAPRRTRSWAKASGPHGSASQSQPGLRRAQFKRCRLPVRRRRNRQACRSRDRSVEAAAETAIRRARIGPVVAGSPRAPGGHFFGIGAEFHLGLNPKSTTICARSFARASDEVANGP